MPQREERQITYFVLSPDELDRMIEKASSGTAMIKPVNAAKKYDTSEEFLNDLVNEGRIRRYKVPGHARVIRYKIEELDNIFKS